ncbi:MAG: ParB/RepB/Spo0J family partition protein [Rhodospirillaceae bacterium]|nr:ParB/RepB/Spo0J family partition protein [Rhodospirillaceae bacterium]
MTGVAMARRRSLGRGLDALFGADADAGAGGDASTVAIEHLAPNPFQPRRRFDDEEMENLISSIRENGVLQPLLVRPLAPMAETPAGPTATYQIVAGERRWRAAQRAGLHEVPVLVREMTDLDVLQAALIENVQRQDLTAVEEAEGYSRLIGEFAYTQETLGRAVGKSRSHIANTLRLLDLPADVRGMVQDGRISAGHARALLATPDPSAAAQVVLDRGLNVRQTEGLARESQADRQAERAERTKPAKDPDTLALEAELAEVLGLRVAIRASADGQSGDLVLRYRSLEQLDHLCRRLSGTDL